MPRRNNRRRNEGVRAPMAGGLDTDRVMKNLGGREPDRRLGRLRRRPKGPAGRHKD